MIEDSEIPLEGGCTCRQARFRLNRAPLFVHCCHCTWCQRESGSAFALNILLETSELELLSGTVGTVDTPTLSGKGQKIVRCPVCQVALWSHYGGAGKAIAFVRAGTLDRAGSIQPDIHIFTRSKQPWVSLPEDVTAVDEYYSKANHWPAQSVERFRAAIASR